MPLGAGLVWTRLRAASASGTSWRSSRNHGLHPPTSPDPSFAIPQIYGHQWWCSETGLKAVRRTTMPNGRRLWLGSGSASGTSEARRFDDFRVVLSVGLSAASTTSPMSSVNKPLTSSLMSAWTVGPFKPSALTSRCRRLLQYTAMTR